VVIDATVRNVSPGSCSPSHMSPCARCQGQDIAVQLAAEQVPVCRRCSMMSESEPRCHPRLRSCPTMHPQASAGCGDPACGGGGARGGRSDQLLRTHLELFFRFDFSPGRRFPPISVVVYGWRGEDIVSNLPSSWLHCPANSCCFCMSCRGCSEHIWNCFFPWQTNFCHIIGEELLQSSSA